MELRPMGENLFAQACLDRDVQHRRPSTSRQMPLAQLTGQRMKTMRHAAEERVFALRTDPLRFKCSTEMPFRNAIDNMRLDWQAPCSFCTENSGRALAAASGTLTRSTRQSSVAGELVGLDWTASEARFPGAFDDRHFYRHACGGAHLCQRAQR